MRCLWGVEMLTEQEFERLIDALIADGVAERPPEAMTLIAAYREQAKALKEARAKVDWMTRALQDCGYHLETFNDAVTPAVLCKPLKQVLLERENDALKKRVVWLEEGRGMLVAVSLDDPAFLLTRGIRAWLAKEPKDP